MPKSENKKISFEFIGAFVLLAYLVIYLNPDWYNMNFIMNNGPIIACFGLYFLSKLQNGIKISKYEIFLFLYIGVSFVSYTLSISPAVSNPYFRDVVMNSIALLYMHEYAEGSEKRAVRLMNFYVIAATITAIYICVTVGISSIITNGIGVETVGGAWNANSISCRLALALSLIGYILCCKKEMVSKHKLYYLFASVVLSFCVIFSGSRTGLILLVGVFASVLFVLNKKHTAFALLISLFSIFFVYQLIMNVEVLYDIIGYRVRNLFLFATNQYADENSIYIRQELIQKGITWFKAKPIFGYGIGTFSYLNNEGYYAHNGYLELLVGMGVIGAFVFFMPMLSALRTGIKHRAEKNAMFIFLMMLLIAVAAYSSVISYSPHYSIVICMYIAAVNVGRKNKSAEKT